MNMSLSNPKAGRNLWTWKDLVKAGANVQRPQVKPHIEVLNRTNRTTYVVKRKKAA